VHSSDTCTTRHLLCSALQQLSVDNVHYQWIMHVIPLLQCDSNPSTCHQSVPQMSLTPGHTQHTPTAPSLNLIAALLLPCREPLPQCWPPAPSLVSTCCSSISQT
jgi:hypothetical protein